MARLLQQFGQIHPVSEPHRSASCSILCRVIIHRRAALRSQIGQVLSVECRSSRGEIVPLLNEETNS